MEPSTASPSKGPRRALIVSADIGAGHNAAGRALEEAHRAPQVARNAAGSRR